MKATLAVSLMSIVLCGCATSTIDSRKLQRSSAYAVLSPEFRDAVDQGEIKVGMNTDAVFLAWGKPPQVLTGETEGGSTTTWLYYGTEIVEYRYWAFHRYYSPYYYSTPTLASDFYPRNYVRAEVSFQNGVVKSWRTMRPPGKR